MLLRLLVIANIVPSSEIVTVMMEATVLRNVGSYKSHTLLRLLVTGSVVPSSLILVTLMMEAIRSSETSFLQELHGRTSQKTAFFIATAMKTSNLTLH
jgi:phospholipid N-methyltransferase